ncbi:MAG: hypothetical protein ABSH33_02785 [Steroidobacteraceae bacterium]
MMRLVRLWRLGGNDLRLLWFALRHPSRPLWLLPATAMMIFYALEPLNFAIPLFGIVDEFVLLPLVLHVIVKCLPAGIRLSFAPRYR